LWQQPERAQELGKERARLSAELLSLDQAVLSAREAGELLAMAEAEGDEATASQIADESRDIEAAVRKLEFRRMFRGQMDSHNAFLDIQAGAGGTEAQDWAQMLMRMYIKWAAARGMSSATR